MIIERGLVGMLTYIHLYMYNCITGKNVLIYLYADRHTHTHIYI